MGSDYNWNPGGDGLTGFNFAAPVANVLDPTIAATFAGSPQAYYQTARLAQMGDLANLPQFQRAANMGFTPAFGQYLLSGAPGEFSSYLGSDAASTFNPATAWADAITASQQATNPDAVLTASQRNIVANLQGEDARRNALAMAAARMGGGAGYTARARQRALGNLYDLYSARAAAAGESPTGFLNYLNTRMGT